MTDQEITNYDTDKVENQRVFFEQSKADVSEEESDNKDMH